MGPQTEIPKYRSFKTVRALKIMEVEQHPLDSGGMGAMLHPMDKDIEPFLVDVNYVKKHNPVAGGYYVLYEDGYESFSPALAFEAGYLQEEMEVGHRYFLPNMEGGGSQMIQFVKKEVMEDGRFQTVVNGTTNEEVLSMMLNRLSYLQKKMPSPYNNEASHHISKALEALNNRTAGRKARGVEGTTTP